MASNVQEHEISKLPDWRGMLGFDVVLEKVIALLEEDALPRVILFEGREGMGKRSLVSAVTAAHFCETHSACGECDGCRQVLSGTHPEVAWIESVDGKNMKLTEAKALQEHVEIKPQSASMSRIAVIVDLDLLNLQAMNRLLKTLEEPPPFARILLTTSKYNLLLDTIKSRCLRWRVRPPSVEQITSFIANFCQNRGITPPEPEVVNGILRCSGLAPAKVIAECLKLEEGQSKLEELCEKILASSREADVIRLSEEMVRKYRYSMTDVIGQMEMSLNKFYRRAGSEALSGSQIRMLGSDVLSRRRDILRQVKEWALLNKVHLNVQYSVEAMGFAGVVRDRKA